jgi:hypothetical protein
MFVPEKLGSNGARVIPLKGTEVAKYAKEVRGNSTVVVQLGGLEPPTSCSTDGPSTRAQRLSRVETAAVNVLPLSHDRAAAGPVL